MSEWPNIADRLPAQSGLLANVDSFVARGGAVAADSAVWTTANAAIYVPVFVPEVATIKRLLHWNGAVASGNLNAAIYDSDTERRPATRLVVMGSTAQAGTSVMQALDIADTVLVGGLYYVSSVMDGVVGTMTRMGLITAPEAALHSFFEELSAFALPATATPTLFTASRSVPIIALDRGTA